MPANVVIFLLSKSKKSNLPFFFSFGSLSVYDGQNCEIDCYSRILIDEARFSWLNLIELSWFASPYPTDAYLPEAISETNIENRVLCIYTLTLPQGNAIFHFFFLRFIYCKTFFKWYIFHKSLFVWHLSFAKRPDIRKFTRFVERFLIIFFEIIFLVAFNGNYQFVNQQKTIVSPLFNICIMKAVKNVPFRCSRT